MQKQILVIHGGDAFETYEAYLESLRSAEISLDRLLKRDWKSRLQETLGNEYQVLLPRFPNSQNARYVEWKIWFEKLIPLLDEKVVFIGHSMGAIFLAKWFSENTYPKKVKAIFMVASPYNTADDNPFVDFILTAPLAGLARQTENIFLYHSKDDPVVPFSALEKYTRELPQAHVRIFEDRKHFNGEEFPEILEDIKKL
jgi:uncharacterized protein